MPIAWGSAHEVNNILQGISGSLSVIMMGLARGQARDLDHFMSAALASAVRAASFIRWLLAFSRREPLDPRPVEANPDDHYGLTTRHTKRRYARTAKRKNGTITRATRFIDVKRTCLSIRIQHMKNTRPRYAYLVLSLVLASTTLASCNTIRGAGRDVSATGDAVADAAAQVQADLARNKAKQDAKDERARAAAARRAARGY